jgi:hypothetical protein
MKNQNERLNWSDEDTYWRTNFRTRPYASSTEYDYDYFQPGFRYGYDSAYRYSDREWKDVEADLSRQWNSYEHRAKSTWEQVKGAVRDAWDRVTNQRHVGAHH